MPYTLNGVDISVYGITPGHCPGSNIAMSGIFDLPTRAGVTYKDWGDEDGIEPWVDLSDIFFKGRDLFFTGSILGTNDAINTYLTSLYTAVQAFTGLVTFSTPYGDFSVQVKSITPDIKPGACSLVIIFREPVVTLTGGNLPVFGTNSYTIDGIPMSSFGLYYSKGNGYNSLPDLKEQYFTKYGSEGYQIAKYKNRTFSLEGLVKGTSISDFQGKIKALYLLFKSADLRLVKLNNELMISCFATEGFKVENVMVLNNAVVARFSMNLLVTDVYDISSNLIDGFINYGYSTLTVDGTRVISGISTGGAESVDDNVIGITDDVPLTVLLNLKLNSGTAPVMYMGTDPTYSPQHQLVAGRNVFTLTISETMDVLVHLATGVATNFSTSEIYVIR